MPIALRAVASPTCLPACFRCLSLRLPAGDIDHMPKPACTSPPISLSLWDAGYRVSGKERWIDGESEVVPYNKKQVRERVMGKMRATICGERK